MPKIKIDAEKLWIAAQFVSTDKLRPYIHGVHIEPSGDGGAVIVATDGARLVALHDPGVEGLTSVALVRLSKQTLAAMKKQKAATVEIDTESREAGAVIVQDARGSVLHIQTDCAAIDGTFPAWRRVVEGVHVGQPATSATFDAKVLGTFSALCGRGNKAPFIQTLPAEDAHSPHFVVTQHSDRFGVIVAASREIVCADYAPRGAWMAQ